MGSCVSGGHVQLPGTARLQRERPGCAGLKQRLLEEKPPKLPELKSQTKVPILLPSHLPALAAETVYAHAKADGYTIRLESDPDCDGANQCFLGMLRAKRGGRSSFPEIVKLGETATGRFKPTSCGGSCSAAAIEWNYKGILYSAQLNLHTESEREAPAEITDLAKCALRHGPR